MTENFANVGQISEIQTLIAERDWNNESTVNAKYINRVAVINLFANWAWNYPEAPAEAQAKMTEQAVGGRINELLAFSLGTAREGSEYAYQPLTEAGANALIGWLHTLPKKSGEAMVKIPGINVSVPAKAETKELEDGMYRDSANVIFKVYHTQRGFQVAKRLCADGNEDGTSTVWFEYEGKRPLARLNASMRMSYEEMKQFGAVYGSCCVCSKTLTDELSVALGIGPICGNREFGEEFKQTVKLTRAELKAAKKAS